MAKRGATHDYMKEIRDKKLKTDQQTAKSHAAAPHSKNPYLSHPVQPEQALHIFLTQVRNAARKYLPKEHHKFPLTTPFCEVEARLGVLKVPYSSPARRVTSSGAKHVNGQTVQAFECSRVEPRCSLDAGVSRSAFAHTSSISQANAITAALGCSPTADSATLKRDLVETELVETVYTGYDNDARVCFKGWQPSDTEPTTVGVKESKDKLSVMDLTVPAAHYDVRVTLSSEKVLEQAVTRAPHGWSSKRVKRRRSYERRDKSIAWQIDVTEVTTTYPDPSRYPEIDYEVEMELRPSVLLQLINEDDPQKLKKMTTSLAQQLWWILSQLNPLTDAVDVEERLRPHPDAQAVSLALAQCGALRRFMDSGAERFDSPIGKSSPPAASLSNIKFPGCMPINFSRHNIDEIQRSPDNAYFLSEKTDGVRHFMVFTGSTVVLVDRAMRGKQPIPIGNTDAEPFAAILPLIQPGTVLDGEVVMHRGGRGRKPRPIFIVFDVLALSTTQPVLHLPFEQRLHHLRRASFRTPTANCDMFDAKLVADLSVALPLVRKNFVKRTDLDELLSHVVEERGMRCYRNGELHNHLTDGVIFQPNRPYTCGTDRHLLKWKYLDTVTIDVEMLPLRPTDDDDTLQTVVGGEEHTTVDMTRYVRLPKSERMRLEADRLESQGRIAEVGFDPEMGEWYYLTMRPDKVLSGPNHISTVLGTLLELAESLTTDELRYRMSVPQGTRDTYRKDMRGMLQQLLEHQRRKLKAARP